MADLNEQFEESHAEENLLGVGQRIIGNLEAIGGVLTGDPVTIAEGEFNTEAGTVRQESNKVLTEIDREPEETPQD
jgi:hypothetical protein